MIWMWKGGSQSKNSLAVATRFKEISHPNVMTRETFDICAYNMFTWAFCIKVVFPICFFCLSLIFNFKICSTFFSSALSCSLVHSFCLEFGCFTHRFARVRLRFNVQRFMNESQWTALLARYVLHYFVSAEYLIELTSFDRNLRAILSEAAAPIAFNDIPMKTNRLTIDNYYICHSFNFLFFLNVQLFRL